MVTLLFALDGGLENAQIQNATRTYLVNLNMIIDRVEEDFREESPAVLDRVPAGYFQIYERQFHESNITMNTNVVETIKRFNLNSVYPACKYQPKSGCLGADSNALLTKIMREWRNFVEQARKQVEQALFFYSKI